MFGRNFECCTKRMNVTKNDIGINSNKHSIRTQTTCILNPKSYKRVCLGNSTKLLGQDSAFYRFLFTRWSRKKMLSFQITFPVQAFSGTNITFRTRLKPSTKMHFQKSNTEQTQRNALAAAVVGEFRNKQTNSNANKFHADLIRAIGQRGESFTYLSNGIHHVRGRRNVLERKSRTLPPSHAF